MTDDDELDASAPFLKHDWELEGVREVGGKLRRCRRCGVLQHWPAAESSCSSVLLYSPAGDIAQKPLFDGQWAGPYVTGPLSTCAVCAREWRRPTQNTAGTTCGLNCSRANRLIAKKLARLAAKASKT